MARRLAAPRRDRTGLEESTRLTSESRQLSAADLEAIFRFSMDGVVVTIPDGRILAANRAACEMLGLTEDEILRRGRQVLAGWLRTTWMPYLERVPAEMRPELVEDVLDAYLARNPLDEGGNAHVRMVRLEVEDVKTGAV
jgi:PAS domain-containing protein